VLAQFCAVRERGLPHMGGNPECPGRGTDHSKGDMQPKQADKRRGGWRPGKTGGAGEAAFASGSIPGAALSTIWKRCGVGGPGVCSHQAPGLKVKECGQCRKVPKSSSTVMEEDRDGETGEATAGTGKE